MQEAALSNAENNCGITDEALCRCDKIYEIANEHYVNVMLY